MKKQSKNVWKILLLTMLLVSTMIITASAATASKVTYKRSIASGKESVTIWGKTSSGKTVWTYRSASYTAAQCNAVTVKTKGSYVYVLEGRKYVRLSKKTGKVLAKKNVLPSGWSWGSPTVVISSNGNLYAMGYLHGLPDFQERNGCMEDQDQRLLLLAGEDEADKQLADDLF